MLLLYGILEFYVWCTLRLIQAALSRYHQAY